MTVLAERRFGDGLAQAVRELARLPRGSRAELWGFDPAPARRAAEARLARAGIGARMRAAWKPALHALLEEAPGATELRWPRAPGPHPDRFLRELHPAAELLPGLRLLPHDGPEHRLGDGRTIRAPLRERALPGGGAALAACGWRRILRPDGTVAEDAPWETPLEQALDALWETLRAQPWRGPGPHFGTLTVRLEAPLEDVPLGVGEEVLSLAEALHEEIYFGALELFAAQAGLPPGDRSLTPGRIVPEVVPSRGAVALRVTATPARRRRARARPSATPVAAAPERIDRPMTAAEIAGALAALGGRALRRRSQDGRPVEARVLAGAGPAVVVTGGQHANEPTGVAAALIAARALADEGAAVAVCPLENPDGHALYERLRRRAPRHMHHAARYTALGADLSHLAGGEAEVRARMRAESGADLHLSLHGYPSHEWMRPFSGHLPPGFEDWALPRGMFLILRCAPGWEARGRRALEAAAAALNADPEVVALNREQQARLARYAPSLAAERIGDVQAMAGLAQPGGFPVTLITEAPDETVEGPLFRLLARAGAAAALAAARAWREARDGSA